MVQPVNHPINSPPLAPTAEPAEPAETPDAISVLGPIARSSVVDAVADRIRGEILSGRLHAGARLPSERELSLALGINRLTLRAALARLEALGLVVTRHGAGTVVASWRERAGLDALGALGSALDPEDPARNELFAAILEVRRILAAEAVALAAERHTEADLAALEAVAESQRANVDDPMAMARGDIAFQRTVIRAAHNVGLELILNTFARFPDEQPELVAMLYDEPRRSLEHYPLVIELIRAGDAASARELVRRALEAMDQVLLSRHATPEIETRAGRPAAPAAPPAPPRRRHRAASTTSKSTKRGKP